MFWLIIASPFIVLLIAAACAPRGPLFRLVMLLLVMCFVIDASLFYYLVLTVGKSTDPVGFALIALVEFLVSIILLVAVVFSRRKVLSDHDELRRSKELARTPGRHR
jgi:hypothetical protein